MARDWLRLLEVRNPLLRRWRASLPAARPALGKQADSQAAYVSMLNFLAQACGSPSGIVASDADVASLEIDAVVRPRCRPHQGLPPA